MKLATLSTWSGHVERWRDCDRCALSRCRSRIVLARGSVPCDVLFLGEAPDRSEDALGKPFVGPAGHLLDEIIAEALERWQVPGTDGPGYNSIRLAFTNLIACIPLDEDEDKLGEPPYESVMACAPRLAEFVQLARPRLIVRVGKHAQDWLEPGLRDSVKLRWDCPFADILHPAFIPRSKDVQRSNMIRRCVHTIRKAVETL